ncbi:hypothetical protein [Halostagnicola kamekurae]|nr:hypothetical protein [Halostagnicola kamekurae]
MAVAVASLYLGVYSLTSLLPAAATAALLVVVARAPILQSRGRFRLKTDDSQETIVDAFTGPKPPVLAFLWGLADEVTSNGNTVKYKTYYLFGLRSVEMVVQRQTETTPDGNKRITLDVTANGKPWATYTSILHEQPDHTAIDVEYTSNRRFDLRDLPKQLLARRYRDATLEAQGYTVETRESHFGL